MDRRVRCEVGTEAVVVVRFVLQVELLLHRVAEGAEGTLQRDDPEGRDDAFEEAPEEEQDRPVQL